MIRDLIISAWFSALRGEARSMRNEASEQCKTQADAGGWRSGNPARFLASAQGGEIQRSIYADGEMAERLGKVAGLPVRPSGAEGSFSYYDRTGHHLGLHRDIRTCDLTLITCLERQPGVEPSGALRLYPRSVNDTLESITPATSHWDIDMLPGDSVLLLGGVVPHEVLPAAEGYCRHISILCFEIVH